MSDSLENKKVSLSTFIFPFIICSIIIFLHVFNIDSLSVFRLNPGRIDSFLAIFLAPFAHSGYEHLINNIIPLFFFMSIIRHAFDTFSYYLFFLLYFVTGVLIWSLAPESTNCLYCSNIHRVSIIGASGVLYSMFSFLFFSGLIRGNRQLAAYSLIIVFLYGGMFWGIFEPFVDPHVSWESHLIGFLVGIILAFSFKNKGPQKKKYDWEDEDEDEDEGNAYRYIIKK